MYIRSRKSGKELGALLEQPGHTSKGTEDMFLALKENKHEQLRFGLIILMIFLISYLIFMLSSLAVGLASQNTQAIENWNAQKIVLNKNANISMSQSILTKDDLKNAKIGKNE